MTTNKIVDELNSITVESSEDDEKLERIHELTDLLRQNSDGYLACEALIALLERHPHVEFGYPGEPVHTLEKYGGYYEVFLFESLGRRPTYMTVWMLNRILNVVTGKEYKELLELMEKCMVHPLADQPAVDAARDFYSYQIGS